MKKLNSENRSVRAAPLAEFLGCSQATVWRWAKENPTFPKPRKIGLRTTVWNLDEVVAWRDSQ